MILTCNRLGLLILLSKSQVFPKFGLVKVVIHTLEVQFLTFKYLPLAAVVNEHDALYYCSAFNGNLTCCY